MAAALAISCCCLSPGAQYLSAKHPWAGQVLSVVGVFCYLCFFSSIFSQYWKGGFAAVGTWCGALCIAAMIVGCCLVCQLCCLGAVAMGMVSKETASMGTGGVTMGLGGK